MGNISKTIRYLKRNGMRDTWYAVQERLLGTKGVPLDEEEFFTFFPSNKIKFSIIVPVYETPEKYLRQMLESCFAQAYGNFELVIADASTSDVPGEIIRSYDDGRVKYIRLPENKGISGNSNAAVEAAVGDFCVLLDHDDMLTEDALYQVARYIERAGVEGIDVKLVYSDEDKCNAEGTRFFGRHYKEKFNLDLLISNNYICHLAAIRTDILKDTPFRLGYDGAQDHDLFLRVVGKIVFNESERDLEAEKEIVHIKRVLYHWRCHEKSTALNPASKEYAYDSGLKAIESFGKTYFGPCSATHLKHRGFYRLNYEDFFFERPDVGAIGGMTYKTGRYTIGILDSKGNNPYSGMNINFSGYMHRTHLVHEVFALDIRTIKVCEALEPLYNNFMAVIETESKQSANMSREAREKFIRHISLKFCEEVRNSGRIVLYDPMMNIKDK